MARISPPAPIQPRAKISAKLLLGFCVFIVAIAVLLFIFGLRDNDLMRSQVHRLAFSALVGFLLAGSVGFIGGTATLHGKIKESAEYSTTGGIAAFLIGAGAMFLATMQAGEEVRVAGIVRDDKGMLPNVVIMLKGERDVSQPDGTFQFTVPRNRWDNGENAATFSLLGYSFKKNIEDRDRENTEVFMVKNADPVDPGSVPNESWGIRIAGIVKNDAKQPLP